jgi:hypothetical protein
MPTMPSDGVLEQLELYAFAAAHNQADIAKEASAHLHALPMDALTDDLARRMGPNYLRRLLVLGLDRIDALKRIIVTGPRMHAPTAACGPARAQALERAWLDAAIWFGHDARAGAPHPHGYLSYPQTSLVDTSAEQIAAAFKPLADGLECPACTARLEERIHAILYHWSLVKVVWPYTFSALEIDLRFRLPFKYLEKSFCSRLRPRSE